MRKYNKEKTMLTEVICNKCGKKLEVREGLVFEEVFYGNHVCGYFSKKDGIRDKFDLCEDCYHEWLHSFLIPAESVQETEFM